MENEAIILEDLITSINEALAKKMNSGWHLIQRLIL